MEFFRFGTREDPARKERLIRIRRDIQASVRFEEEAMSKPVNASTLKRIYNIDSLWIVGHGETKQLGSANYAPEISAFRELKERFGNLGSIRLQKGGDKYHVVERMGKIYAFSTPLDLASGDVLMMLHEIEESLEKKRIFLSSDANISLK
jgi:hypothetical protein